ncbi:MAG: hypothetical protein KCHDKBKB_00117 [Elusimicrobia bacterium]|nr:hypothetical protein [Elusimicrobiota bacterium]
MPHNRRNILGRVADMNSKKFHILLVEDDHLDAHITKKYLAQAIEDASIEHISDGPSAVDYLLKRKVFRKATTPSLLVLDLNLPGVSGLEIVQLVYANKVLKKIPILIISGEAKKEWSAEAMGSLPVFIKWMGMKDFKSIARAARDIYLGRLAYGHLASKDLQSTVEKIDGLV